MRDERVLHGAGREQRADEHHRGEQPPVPRAALTRDAAAGVPRGAARRGRARPEGHDGRADDAGDEREPDPDRPEMGVDHQQAEVAVARTRPGYCAV